MNPWPQRSPANGRLVLHLQLGRHLPACCTSILNHWNTNWITHKPLLQAKSSPEKGSRICSVHSRPKVKGMTKGWLPKCCVSMREWPKGTRRDDIVHRLYHVFCVLLFTTQLFYHLDQICELVLPQLSTHDCNPDELRHQVDGPRISFYLHPNWLLLLPRATWAEKAETWYHMIPLPMKPLFVGNDRHVVLIRST